MGSLLAPAKSGIIFIGILIGQVGRGPFLVPVMLLASPPATSLLNPTISLHQFPRSCYFPGTRFEGHTEPACVSLGKVGTHTISQVLARGVTRLVSGGSRRPTAGNPLSGERQIQGSHEILESRNCDLEAGAASTCACQSDGSHTDMKAGGCPSERSAFIRHINLPVSSSNPGWPLLCQPNGLRLPTVWGAMSQAIVGYDLPALRM